MQFLCLTVKHCAAVMKALFTRANMPMATTTTMETYVAERGDVKKWRNQLIRSWNGVSERGKVRMGEEDAEFVVNEMEKLDVVFTTNFKEGKYFMTGATEWSGMWEHYVEGLERYGDALAQRADLTAERATLVDMVIPKMRFMLTETNEATLMPPMPLLTRSVLPVMIGCISDVAKSLREVSDRW